MIKEEKYMEMAMQEAFSAYEKGEVPVGALLISEDERFVIKGHNKTEERKNSLFHAEMEVLQKAQETESFDLSQSVLYVTLEPCMMCLGALALMQVPLVVYALPCQKFGIYNALLAQGYPLESCYPARMPLCKQGPYLEQSKDLLQKYFLIKRQN